jgi:Zn-dependent protease
MLRFRLGSIPVEVHPSHLLVSGLLAWLMLDRGVPTQQQEVWPYRQLANPEGPEYTLTAALFVLSWVLIVFVSALVHELGHALAGRAFGYRPSISLVWMGGHTRTNAPGPIPWKQLVVLTAAGPLFGLALGVGAWVGYRHAGENEVLDFLLGWMAVANLVWTVVNLLPVLPLDGGHIVSAVAQRFFGMAGFLGAQVLALLVSLGLVLFAVAARAPLMGLFFGVYGWQALRLLLAGARGELQGPVSAPERLVLALKEGHAALEAGQLAQARQLGESLLEAEESTPELASRAHHLLGWVALKQGQGREALDHFSQVQRRPVEAHAVAAAFSLVGDEPRALALWKLAWQESADRTVLHEYAGSLIRSQRVQEALELPGVEPEQAFLCAERALFIRGAYSEAAAVAEAGLAHAPGARLAYEAACAHARARHRDDAVRMLRRATALGFQDAAYAASDEDLSALHGHSGFEQWLTQLRESAPA